MPLSRMEAVLQALEAVIRTHAPSGALVLRNSMAPARLPAAGAIVIWDGTPGEAEVLLSIPEYYYEHEAEVEIMVDRPPAARDAAFDALRRAVGAAIAADRTLGGLCDYVDGEAPAPVMVPVDGADGLKAATIPVVLRYGSPDPLI